MKTKDLALRNIKNKPQRTFALALLTCVITLVLSLSSVVIFSLNNGMTSLANRMGADIIVVPEGYDSKIAGAILRGEPNTFFLKSEVLDRIRAVDGVAEATPQLYLATLSAGCCSFPIQIIGIEQSTDFLVAPWLKHTVNGEVKGSEVLVGFNIVGNYNDEIKFFSQNFTIKGRLQQTGMGFDNSVFMSLEETRRLAKEFEKMLEYEGKDLHASYSSVMIRIKQGYDVKTVQNAIRAAFKGEQVYPLASKQMMSEVARNMNGLTTFLYLLVGLVWALAFIVLVVVYGFSVKERKREIGTFRIIGATKGKVRNMLLIEALLVNGVGALIGTALGMSAAVLFSTAISESAKLPFLMPSAGMLLLLSLATLALGTLLGPVAAVMASGKINRQAPQELLRAGE